MIFLLTNDDGYKAKGLAVLSKIMQGFGDVTVIAPKRHQSGMGMAVDLGLKQLAYKDLGTIDGARWSYLDSTPASCVKYGLNFMPHRPDVIISGINHGSNASTGACYSGTLGACQEGTLNGIPSIGVSLCDMSVDADFTAVEKLFPEIFKKLISSLPERKGIYYNINFPAMQLDKIKGIKVTTMGIGHWIKEFKEWDPNHMSKYGITPESLGRIPVKAEEGEKLYMMVGDYVDSPDNGPDADNHALAEGYVTITAHNVFNADKEEIDRLRSIGLEKDFNK